MKSRSIKLALLSSVLVGLAGCGYFRWHDPSYEEVHERVQQDSATNQPLFDPGKTFFPTKP